MLKKKLKHLIINILIILNKVKIEFKINFAIVDLPDPDSPASTNTSPLFRLNETPSTAFTVTVFDLNTDFLTKNLLRFSILKISPNILN